jgi:hypothetical protein
MACLPSCRSAASIARLGSSNNSRGNDAVIESGQGLWNTSSGAIPLPSGRLSSRAIDPPPVENRLSQRNEPAISYYLRCIWTCRSNAGDPQGFSANFARQPAQIYEQLTGFVEYRTLNGLPSDGTSPIMEIQAGMKRVGRSFLSIAVPCRKRHPIGKKSS